MINTLFYIAVAATILLFIFYWYAEYSTKSGFAKDENENSIPDSWEKYAIIFKLKSIIILIAGIVLGFLFSHASILN
ncbi:MAG: hypothetical protein ACPG7X_08585 [Flavobacteriaceae bacterium]